MEFVQVYTLSTIVTLTWATTCFRCIWDTQLRAVIWTDGYLLALVALTYGINCLVPFIHIEAFVTKEPASCLDWQATSI